MRTVVTEACPNTIMNVEDVNGYFLIDNALVVMIHCEDMKKTTKNKKPKKHTFAGPTEKVQGFDTEPAAPVEYDVRDELDRMDGYRDYLQENRGSLTFGDY